MQVIAAGMKSSLLAQAQGLVETGTNNTLQTPELLPPEQGKKTCSTHPHFSSSSWAGVKEFCLYVPCSLHADIYTRPDTGVFTLVELRINLQTVPLDPAGLLLNVRNYTSRTAQRAEKRSFWSLFLALFPFCFSTSFSFSFFYLFFFLFLFFLFLFFLFLFFSVKRLDSILLVHPFQTWDTQ